MGAFGMSCGDDHVDCSMPTSKKDLVRELAKALKVNLDESLKTPNPNPERYEPLRAKHCLNTKRYVVELRYDGCTNFEGRKILVFASKTIFRNLNRNRHIDPHFEKGNGLIARFAPDQWELACRLADCK